MFIRHRAASTRWLGSFLTAKNVTLTWYRLSNITVYSSRTLLSPIYFLEFQQVDVQICDRIPGKKSTVEIRISVHFFSFDRISDWENVNWPTLTFIFDREFEREILLEIKHFHNISKQINTSSRIRSKIWTSTLQMLIKICAMWYI